MKYRKSSRDEKSTSIALLFFGFCLLLIGASVLVKVLLLFYSAKFDGAHQFILRVKNGRQVVSYINFSPDTQTASVLEVKGQGLVDIPYDATVIDPHVAELTSFGQSILFHHDAHDSLNLVDRARIFLFVSSIKDAAITYKTLSLPTNRQTEDTLLSQLFTDHTLYSENMTIGIMNGTGVSGLADNAAKMIGDIGGDVISVGTAPNVVSQTTLVYSGKPSYTTTRLASIFHAQMQSTTAAMLTDIVLTIGKDDVSLVQ